MTYYGYWLAGSKNQIILRSLNYLDLRAQWGSISTAVSSPMQMTRVQAYPQKDAFQCGITLFSNRARALISSTSAAHLSL